MQRVWLAVLIHQREIRSDVADLHFRRLWGRFFLGLARSSQKQTRRQKSDITFPMASPPMWSVALHSISDNFYSARFFYFTHCFRLLIDSAETIEELLRRAERGVMNFLETVQ